MYVVKDDCLKMNLMNESLPALMLRKPVRLFHSWNMKDKCWMEYLIFIFLF